MANASILFISGSLGLGHVTRDIAIAREIRLQYPKVDILWLAAHPASILLQNAGENVVPDAAHYANENDFAEKSAQGSKLNLLSYLLKARDAWKQNVNVFTNIVSSQQFDLVIGDETYEINLALRARRDLKKFSFVMIYDFVGLDAMSANPFEKLGAYIWNRKWSHDYRKHQKPPYDLGLFVGDPGDIPDKSFGPMLPNRRQFAEAMYKFVGYVFPFKPSELRNQAEIRKKLGYGPEPLIVASIGGTSIGKEILELCAEAGSILREDIPTLQMVLVAGPRLATNTLKVPKDIILKSFIPRLYEHFAACDLAIVQGGATSTLELTALQRPFIYFPIEGHSEQANVAKVLERRKAGQRMNLSETSPAQLAQTISKMLNAKMTWPEIPANGAHKAAQLIVQLLNQSRQPSTGA
jgi:UDP:flavonoid glycosyltransferase YjiC (YdhE family)